MMRLLVINNDDAPHDCNDGGHEDRKRVLVKMCKAYPGQGLLKKQIS